MAIIGEYRTPAALDDLERFDSIDGCTHCHFLGEKCTVLRKTSKCTNCARHTDRRCSFDDKEASQAMVMFARFPPERDFLRAPESKDLDLNIFADAVPVRFHTHMHRIN